MKCLTCGKDVRIGPPGWAGSYCSPECQSPLGSSKYRKNRLRQELAKIHQELLDLNYFPDPDANVWEIPNKLYKRLTETLKEYLEL